MFLLLRDGLGSLNMFSLDRTISGLVTAVNIRMNYFINGLTILWSAAKLPLCSLSCNSKYFNPEPFYAPKYTYCLTPFIRTPTQDHKTPTPVVCSYSYSLESPRSHFLKLHTCSLFLEILICLEQAQTVFFKSTEGNSATTVLSTLSLSGACKSEPLCVLRR